MNTADDFRETLNTRQADLSLHEFAVGHALASFMNDRDGSCWPAIETTGKRAHVGRTATKTALHGLVEKGLLTEERRPLMTTIYRPSVASRPMDDSNTSPAEASNGPSVASRPSVAQRPRKSREVLSPSGVASRPMVEPTQDRGAGSGESVTHPSAVEGADGATVADSGDVFDGIDWRAVEEEARRGA